MPPTSFRQTMRFAVVQSRPSLAINAHRGQLAVSRQATDSHTKQSMTPPWTTLFSMRFLTASSNSLQNPTEVVMKNR